MADQNSTPEKDIGTQSVETLEYAKEFKEYILNKTYSSYTDPSNALAIALDAVFAPFSDHKAKGKASDASVDVVATLRSVVPNYFQELPFLFDLPTVGQGAGAASSLDADARSTQPAPSPVASTGRPFGDGDMGLTQRLIQSTGRAFVEEAKAIWNQCRTRQQQENMLFSVLPRSLDYLRSDELASGEDVCDAFVPFIRSIIPLSPNDHALIPRVVDCFGPIYRALMADLTATSPVPAQGWLQSAAALSSVIVTLGDSPSINRRNKQYTNESAMFLHHKFFEICTRFPSGHSLDGGLVSRAANNYRAILAETRSTSKNVDDQRLNEVLGSLSAIAITLGLGDGRVLRPDLVSELNLSPPVVDASGKTKYWDGLDRMNMVASAVGLEEDGGEELVLRLLGAVARAEIGQTSRIPSALFNAGVVLRRGKAPLPSDVGPRRVSMTRMLWNALGLAWALRNADSLDTALVERDGFDCAVNMFGSLGDSINRDQEDAFLADWRTNGNLRNIRFWLTRAMADVPNIPNVDRGRITGSWERIWGKATAPSDPSMRLEEAVQSLIQQLWQQHLEQPEDVSGRWNGANGLAFILRRTVETLFGEGFYRKSVQGVEKHLSRFMGEGKGVLEIVQDAYSGYCDFDEKAPGLYCGLVSSKRWEELAGQYAPALTEDDRLADLFSKSPAAPEDAADREDAEGEMTAQAVAELLTEGLSRDEMGNLLAALGQHGKADNLSHDDLAKLQALLRTRLAGGGDSSGQDDA